MKTTRCVEGSSEVVFNRARAYCSLQGIIPAPGGSVSWPKKRGGRRGVFGVAKPEMKSCRAINPGRRYDLTVKNRESRAGVVYPPAGVFYLVNYETTRTTKCYRGEHTSVEAALWPSPLAAFDLPPNHIAAAARSPVERTHDT